MRILVVGAGAIGGYFGGRLLAKGRDITFLVRPKRAEELATRGLVIKSPTGDLTIPNPPAVIASGLKDAYDVILLSCKAFDLDDAIASFAPAVGPNTAILPMLNGMRHLDVLEKKFDAQHVLGGQCQIATTLNAQREIIHLQEMQSMSFGERDGTMSDRVKAIAETLGGAGFAATASTEIMQEMWEKWVFLASLASSTSLMRANIGEINRAPRGREIVMRIADECSNIADANGHAPRAAMRERLVGMLTADKSTLTASMFRDILAGAPIEADQIVGDLIARRRSGAESHLALLDIVYAHLKAYENRRAASN